MYFVRETLSVHLKYNMRCVLAFFLTYESKTGFCPLTSLMLPVPKDQLSLINGRMGIQQKQLNTAKAGKNFFFFNDTKYIMITAQMNQFFHYELPFGFHDGKLQHGTF